jgi:beta-glucosidase/6-phospho-beta-glucosidase/beta-galactosidase
MRKMYNRKENVMPAMTKDNLIPLVNKIRDLTGRNYYLSKHMSDDGTYALLYECNDMCGQGYVPICDLFEQMVSYIHGIKVGMTVERLKVQKEKD